MKINNVKKCSFFISFDKTKIFYEIRGNKSKKETIIFLHGLGGNMRAWDKQVEFFQNKGYRTITFDLRGHGLSDRPKNINDYELNKFAKDILFFLKIYKIKKFVLIGHCLGGAVALKVVRQLKIQPRATVLISTSVKPFRFNIIFFKYSQFIKLLADILLKLPFPLGKIKQTSFEKFLGTGDFDLRRIASDTFYTTLKSYLAVFSHITILNDNDLLDYINCPTFIIHGAKDKIISLTNAYSLNKNIKKSKLIIFPTANHIIPLNNSKDLIDCIETHMKE